MSSITQDEIDTNAVRDELITKQQEAIDKEISSSIPLVGIKEPLTVLLPDYSEDPIYTSKIHEINKTYDNLRRMRPDGNCFFRAFCYGSLERLIENPNECKGFREIVVASKDIFTKAGFTQFTVDDFYDNFIEIVDKVAKGMTETELNNAFIEQSFADYLVVYLRLLTSAELRNSEDFYSNFIDGDRTLAEFCQLEVEPMYKESDHIHICAITKALGISVRVVYMDRGEGAQHDFPETTEPIIYLLYRPGHYDILYPKKTSLN